MFDRDDIVAKQMSEKLSNAQKQMQDLKQQERKLLTKMQQETDNKKLRIF